MAPRSFWESVSLRVGGVLCSQVPRSCRHIRGLSRHERCEPSTIAIERRGARYRNSALNPPFPLAYRGSCHSPLLSPAAGSSAPLPPTSDVAPPSAPPSPPDVEWEAERLGGAAPLPPPSPPRPKTCEPRESFVLIDFEEASLIRNNLGWTTAPHEMYYRGIGTTAMGERIDLRITNESEYL